MEQPKRVVKKFTPEQKFNIIQIVEKDLESGLTMAMALEKHGLAHSTYHGWKKKLLVGVKSSLRNGKPPADKDKKKLERENEKLKQIILSQSEEIAALKKETNWD